MRFGQTAEQADDGIIAPRRALPRSSSARLPTSNPPLPPTANGANKNTASALGNSYGYDAADRLTSATIGGTGYAFGYDSSGRLDSSSGARFQYAGIQLVGEYNSSGVLTTRHVPGPGLDQPVATWFGSARVQQIADERGSVLGVADAGGSVTVNRYDEYGVASAANRFQYTGQAWMAPGLYHYRAWAYAPELGRFLQTDPIGYEAGPNVYAYVGVDPVNWTDPLGLQEAPAISMTGMDVWCRRIRVCRPNTGNGSSQFGGRNPNPSNPQDRAFELDDVVVSATRALSSIRWRRIQCGVRAWGRTMNDAGGELEFAGAAIAVAGGASLAIPVVGEVAAAVLVPAGATVYLIGEVSSLVGALGLGVGGDVRGMAVASATAAIPSRLGPRHCAEMDRRARKYISGLCHFECPPTNFPLLGDLRANPIRGSDRHHQHCWIHLLGVGPTAFGSIGPNARSQVEVGEPGSHRPNSIGRKNSMLCRHWFGDLVDLGLPLEPSR